jgi:hypothetical protein
MSTNVTNAEYIELVEAIVDELRPDQPVKVVVTKVTNPRTGKQSEKLAICLDVFNGPQTQVLFNFADVLGLGELQLRMFITGKLTSIGVHPADTRQSNHARITDDVSRAATDAEAAKMREMIASRKDRPQEPAVAPAVQEMEEDLVKQTGSFFSSNPDADGDVSLGEVE